MIKLNQQIASDCDVAAEELEALALNAGKLLRKHHAFLQGGCDREKWI